MNWLKRYRTAIVAAITFFVAALAAIKATQRREESLKWQKTAEDIAVGNTEESIRASNQAMTKAKVHASEAERIALKAGKKLDNAAKSDETLTSIVDSWRAG